MAVRLRIRLTVERAAEGSERNGLQYDRQLQCARRVAEVSPPAEPTEEEARLRRPTESVGLAARLNDDSSTNDQPTSQSLERTPVDSVKTEISGEPSAVEGSGVQERFADTFEAGPEEPSSVQGDADRRAFEDDAGGGDRDIYSLSPVDSSEREPVDPSRAEQSAIPESPELNDRLTDDREAAPDRSPEPLDGRLQNIFDQSAVTPAGRSFYESDDLRMRAHAQEVSPQLGKYTVDMHGDAESVYVGRDQLSADDLGTMLHHDPNWSEQPVFLMSCDTGSDPQGFGQQLADKLDTDVWAPTELAYSRPDGTVFSSSATAVSFGLPPDGKWIQYHSSTETRDQER